MPINFIANDPLAADPASSAVQSITPHATPAATRSGIDVQGLPPENAYPVGTPDFIAWQAREAALRAIAATEAAHRALPGWTGDPAYRLLPLVPVAGQDLNAYYDRNSISFFVARVAGSDVYSGASTDVVAHEAGHAILDAVRPDLWGVNLMEVGAFHEGFGDVVAILTALADKATRVALLAIGLRQPNFVEATAEALSDAVRRVKGPNHPAAAPRRALNTHTWSFPTSLPPNGPPDVLINEEHSLGQLVSGIFYDLVCEIFAGDAAQTEGALLTAANTAMNLVMDAIAATPIRPRFLEAWGRTMAAIDTRGQGGANGAAIATAFGNHGIFVGGPGLGVLAPRIRLAKANARRSQSKQFLTQGAKSMLRNAMGFAPGERLSEREIDVGGDSLVEVSATRQVDLTGISERLANVNATVAHPAIVGEVDAAPALLGAIDSEFAMSEEVRAYVQSLVANGSIDFDGRRKAKVGMMAAGAVGVFVGNATTHRIVTRAGQKYLERTSFSCGCRIHRQQ